MRLTRSFVRLLLSTLFSLISGCFAYGQMTAVTNSTSTPIPGAGHDYIKMLSEIVNPANGSVSMRLQTPVPAGRGPTIPFSFAYDSNGVEFPIPMPQVVGQSSWGAVSTFWSYGGWSYSLPILSYLTLITPLTSYHVVCQANTGFVFQDASGGRHSLGLAYAQPVNNSACNSWPLTYQEIDSGGDDHYRANLGGGTNPYVVDAAGTVYSFGYAGLGSNGLITSLLPASIEDTNGNIVKFSGSSNGSFTQTDTLGRTSVSASGFSTPQNTVTVSGLSNPYVITWGTANTNFTSPNYNVIPQQTGCTFNGSDTVSGSAVISSITLPNNKQFTFTYEGTFGQLSKITYPSGGYVQYTWGFNPYSGLARFPANTPGGPPYSTCEFVYSKPAVIDRYVSFDGTTLALHQHFSYSTTWSPSYTDTWTSMQTVVTTTDLLRNVSFTDTYTYGPIRVPDVPDFPYQPDNQIPVEATIVTKDNTGTTIRTVNKSWVDQFELSSEQTVLENGLTSASSYTYGPGAQVTEKDEYDFGSAPHGPLLRKTATSYQSFGANSIFDRPCQVIAYDSSGTNRIAETDYLYDGGTSVCGAAGTTSVASVSNLPTGTHDETKYGPTSTAARGNATTITKQCFPSCANAVTTFTYDETGQVVSMKDACGNAACSDMTGTNHTTTYSYADSYTVLSGGVNVNYTPSANTNAFLTQITDQLGHTQNFTYDFNNGQPTVSKNPNALSTTYIYNDSLARPTQSNSPDGGQTTWSYNDNAPSPSVTTSKKIDSTKTLTTAGVLDGLGHVVQTKLCEDGPACTQPIMTDMAYDGLGRVITKSNPHRSGSAPTDGTTTFFYDALGRSCLVVPPDGTLPTGNVCPATSPANDVFTTYSGNTTSAIDQAGKSRKSVTDGLGRLTQVFEDPTGSNYETDYTYDTLDNLLTVNQKGNDPSSANWRTRSFAYNSLSRLTSSTNPEANTQPVSPFAIVPTTYAYDANGNLSTKTAPAPNQAGTATVTTTYTYDVLNRLTQKVFSDSTPVVKYGYDAIAPPGCTLPTLTINNGIGKRTGMCDAGGAEAWSYDITVAVGWKITDARTTNGVTKSTIVQNNLAGSPATLTYPSTRIITYAYDTDARPISAIDSSGPINYATAAAYAPTGALSSLTNGASVVSTLYFNNRLQPCRISVKYTGTAPSACTDAVNIGNVLDFNYNFSVGAADNGNITAITNNLYTTRSQSFTYDSLNRIATAKTTSTSGTTCWDELFGYDPWGNLLTIGRITGYSCSNEELLNTSATPQNRISGNTYDTAGNLTAIPSIATYIYNAENQLTATAGTTYTYDGDGKRVQKSSGKLYWYGMGSDPLDETDAAGNTNNVSFNEYIFFGGKRIARRDYSNNVNYYFADHLGTARIIANSSGTVLDDSDFFPFGGERVVSSSSGNSYKFTGKERDSESGLDNFGARYNSSATGRFMSPDPKILSIRHLVNPQKWNKYAYTINNPLRYFDPNGMEEIEVQLRAFIPQQSVRDPIGRTFLGDNRSFSTNPHASSRTSITVRIETDASKRANPIISTTSSAGQTVQVGADGHFDHIVTANTGLPSVTGGRDANGNVVLNLQQNTKNPLEPQLLTPGIKADLNVTIPQNASSVTAAGTTSGFPGIELNVTPDGQPTTNIPLNDPGPNGSALGLLSTNTVLVSKPLPPPPPPCETDRNRKCQ